MRGLVAFALFAAAVAFGTESANAVKGPNWVRGLINEQRAQQRPNTTPGSTPGAPPAAKKAATGGGGYEIASAALAGGGGFDVTVAGAVVAEDVGEPGARPAAVEARAK